MPIIFIFHQNNLIVQMENIVRSLCIFAVSVNLWQTVLGQAGRSDALLNPQAAHLLCFYATTDLTSITPRSLLIPQYSATSTTCGWAVLTGPRGRLPQCSPHTCCFRLSGYFLGNYSVDIAHMDSFQLYIYAVHTSFMIFFYRRMIASFPELCNSLANVLLLPVTCFVLLSSVRK